MKAKQKIIEKIKKLDIRIANIFVGFDFSKAEKREKLVQKRKNLADELLYDFE